MKRKFIYTNHLIHESSPYLLLHAHNPVDWYPWGPEALEKAHQENKPLIISIGYTACHWCHVMEHESFSNEEVATIMNTYFVAIKVDREERPDIDQVYMEAAQMLTGSGGWPLNAFALPDGKPFFAGTYFTKERWLMLLNQIHSIYQEEPQKLIDQAQSVTQGIRQSSAMALDPSPPDFDVHSPDQIVASWQNNFDYVWGGEKRAPKFPLPIGYRYLLHYYYLTRHTSRLDRTLGDNALKSVTVTLDKMAMGGIYDQAGGGFARYSTDQYWKVPHFEKMLYDNAQLVSLYSQAYPFTKNPLYKSIVYQTLEFVEQELTAPPATHGGNGFYSSLDADSEGEEGKFYVWTKKEIATLLGLNAPLICDYFNITQAGNWENGSNILFRTKTDQEFAIQHQITPAHLQETLAKARHQLQKTRAQRIRPALDDKILTAWNGLMLKAYIDAYRVFDDPHFLDHALSNADFIVNNMMDKDGRLNRNYKNGVSSINGFLDDYAFTIDAFIVLYQATFNEKWLSVAEQLVNYTFAHFFDEQSRMFFYTSDLDPQLIARKMEILDNVIPASNSQMALNLYLLGQYFDKKEYTQTSRHMLNNVIEDVLSHGPYYANWGVLLLYFTIPPAEVAIVGENCQSLRQQLSQHFLPHILLMGGKTEGKLPLLAAKFIPGQTLIYVCRNKTCRLPVTTVAAALKQILGT